MNNNAAVFIDIAKQYHSITRMNRDVRIDYKILLDEMNKENHIHRAYAYGVQIGNESESFIRMLRHIGYNTKYKYAKLIKEYSVVNGNLVTQDKPSIQDTSWTLGIALDVIRNLGYINKVIIGSNDIELIDLLYWIKEKGCLVEIYSRNIPHELRMIADKTFDIPNHALQITDKETKTDEPPTNTLDE